MGTSRRPENIAEESPTVADMLEPMALLDDVELNPARKKDGVELNPARKSRNIFHVPLGSSSSEELRDDQLESKVSYRRPERRRKRMEKENKKKHEHKITPSLSSVSLFSSSSTSVSSSFPPIHQLSKSREEKIGYQRIYELRCKLDGRKQRQYGAEEKFEAETGKAITPMKSIYYQTNFGDSCGIIQNYELITTPIGDGCDVLKLKRHIYVANIVFMNERGLNLSDILVYHPTDSTKLLSDNSMLKNIETSVKFPFIVTTTFDSKTNHQPSPLEVALESKDGLFDPEKGIMNSVEPCQQEVQSKQDKLEYNANNVRQPAYVRDYMIHANNNLNSTPPLAAPQAPDLSKIEKRIENVEEVVRANIDANGNLFDRNEHQMNVITSNKSGKACY